MKTGEDDLGDQCGGQHLTFGEFANSAKETDPVASSILFLRWNKNLVVGLEEVSLFQSIMPRYGINTSGTCHVQRQIHVVRCGCGRTCEIWKIITVFFFLHIVFYSSSVKPVMFVGYICERS